MDDFDKIWVLAPKERFRYVFDAIQELKAAMKPKTARKSKQLSDSNFMLIWNQYPNRQGKKAAERHFIASVKNLEDFQNCEKALKNYLDCETVKKGFIKNGSTWFNDWQSWINPTPEMMGNIKPIKEVLFK